MSGGNLFADEWDLADRASPPGFHGRIKRLGGEEIGASLYELPPGQSTWPYHYEWGTEEWVLAVSGRPTLRTPDGERELAPGDVAVFPQGPAGAHQVVNRTDEPARVVILSTRSAPAVAVYPDSDKIGVWPGNDDDTIIVRRSAGVDYWDGESEAAEAAR